MPSSNRPKRPRRQFPKNASPAIAVEQSPAAVGHNNGPHISTWGERGPNPAQIPATELLGSHRHVCLVGGARSGKTTTIVRAIVMRALRFPNSRHVILRFRAIHADASIALDTMPKVLRNFFPGQRYKHIKSPHNLFRFPNGSEIWIGGLDDERRADKILGAEYATIFLNECSQISWYSAKLVMSRLAQVIEGCAQRFWCDINPVGKSHWTNRLFGDKIDPDDRKAVADPENYARMFVNPKDNQQNLDKGYFDWLSKQSGNYRKRFYEGQYIDEVTGALWTIDLIEQMRLRPGDEPAEFARTVIAIDPSGAGEQGDKSDIEMKPRNDEIGIIVASLGNDQRAYLRADVSLVGSPEEWGRRAVAAFYQFGADHIIAEGNFGGDMVAYVIRSIDPNVPVRIVRASQGKHIRAEPISTLYTNDAVRHVGEFNELEDQLCAFTTLGYGGPKSPDRADAWIWAVNDLCLGSGASNWLEYYRRLAEAAGNEGTPDPQHGYEITPPAAKGHRVLVPEGVGSLYLIDGTHMLVPADRIVTVSPEDAAAFGRRGWQAVT